MKYEITAELHLKNIIAATRETAEALKDFADRLEQIEKKYADKEGSEETDETD